MSKTVLIVDDAAVMRMTIRVLLVRHGFEVVGEAKNGLEAVDKYKVLKPDLVTMDIVMPEMDGIAAVKEIVAHDADAKIVMCTSLDEQALVVEAIAAGATSFVLKPFHPPKLLETIDRVFG